MRRLLVAGLLGIGVLLLAPAPVFACSCATRDVATQVRTAESVATGTVLWAADNGQIRIYSVTFDAVYKGQLARVERVQTSVAESACGLRVVPDKRYLFFLDGTHRGVIRANSCGGTTLSSANAVAAVQRITGPPAKPLSGPSIKPATTRSQGSWWWGYAVGLLVIGIGGGAVLLGRRRLRRTPGELDARNS